MRLRRVGAGPLFRAAREALALSEDAGRDQVLVARDLDCAAPSSRIPGTGSDRART